MAVNKWVVHSVWPCHEAYPGVATLSRLWAGSRAFPENWKRDDFSEAGPGSRGPGARAGSAAGSVRGPPGADLEQGERGDEGERDDVGGEQGRLGGEQPVGQPAEDPGREDRQVGVGDVVGAPAAPGAQQLGKPGTGREEAG